MTTTQRGSMMTDESHFIRANGIDIHYVEAGSGPDLVLLHGGIVSTNPIWTGFPIAYRTYLDTFAQHCHVIAPDTRGMGKTSNPAPGQVLFDQLADDVAALIEALQLERPVVCGFSDGGITATILGIKHPRSVGAIVNDAGHDQFNPQAPSFAMARQVFGGAADATRSDPAALEQWFKSMQMSAVFDLMIADHDSGQGSGAWKRYLEFAFDRATQPPGYTVEDLDAISVPTLVLGGDRDQISRVEEAVQAYRKLRFGELCILPGVGHYISPMNVQITIDFVTRHATA